MYREPLSRFVKDWDEFLERWYAPVVVYLVSVGISFFWIFAFIGGLDLAWLTFSFVLSLFGGAAYTYAVYVRHNTRVGPTPKRI
jgi:hypothetical protein